MITIQLILFLRQGTCALALDTGRLVDRDLYYNLFFIAPLLVQPEAT